MSLESSPYLPLRMSFSSKTGVSRVVAPWRLKTSVTVSKRRSRWAASSPVPVPVSDRYEDSYAHARGQVLQSRVPLGTFKLKLLLDLSSLPMSSSTKPVNGSLQYGRRGVRLARNAVHVNLLGADVRRRVYRKSAGRAKWGKNSRMSREGDSNYGQERASARLQKLRFT
jgi:hypothetical protein